MKVRYFITAFLASLLAVCSAGCGMVSGKPSAGIDVPRPEQVLDFATLYGQNCAGCHGANGKNGAAISLANPVYLALAGESNLRRATAKGVPGSLMPPFAKSSGGLLTDRQIDSIVNGMLKNWSGAGGSPAGAAQAYSSSTVADPSNGRKTFEALCAKCHTGTSLVDPTYLALISDQGLRSMIIAGHPGPEHRWSEQEVTDTVAWLAAHRL